MSRLAFASDRPQDARAFVRAVVANEVAADANDHSRWMYRDEDGVPGNGTVKLVIQTSQGDLSKAIERDGQPLPPQQQKKDEEKMDAFVNDASLRQKQKHDHEEDAEKASALTKMLPDAFLWSVAEQNGTTTTLKFKPDPSFHPPTRESRVFAAMEGTMVVNAGQKRIQQLKGTLTRDVNFGYGLLGKLEKGGTFEIARQEIAPGVWAITATHIHIHGHALIFKSIGEEQDEVTSHYHPTPSSLSLADAAKMLKDGTAARALQ
jgi:mannose-6-phosphate isomerase-like protein (cupin superfamily)